jgi:tRNA A-37 threonylcarbamoyl transferase component Bud32
VTFAAGALSERVVSGPRQTVLADGPLHKVVRCDAGRDGWSGALIAKYYRDGQGAHAARVMKVLYAAAERSVAATPLRVPRMLGYDAQRGLLLQEVAPGHRLDSLLAGAHALEALDLAGRALAGLHRLQASIGRRRDMRGHIDDLIRPHPDRLVRGVPDLAPRLRHVLAGLLDAEAHCAPCRSDVTIHRDVHPRQLFLEEERVCLIDWDLSARGDAALDVGNFVAYLRARRRMDQSAVDALLRGYAAGGSTDVLARVPLYEALTYVRLTCKRFRLGGPGWREDCAGLIARAESCLE